MPDTPERAARPAAADRAPAAHDAQMLQVPRLLPAPAADHVAGGQHSISLNTAYGDVVESAEVAEPDFAAALRRFYNRAMERTNAVVVLDGVVHTRNSFLEFVREFNQCAARSAQLQHH